MRPVLEQFAASAPGAFVEEKELALGWHYRLADAEFGAWLANELVATLENLLAGTEATVLRGNKIIEVRFAWANKGELAGRLSALAPAWIAHRVGRGRPHRRGHVRSSATSRLDHPGRPGADVARFRLAGPAAVVGLLRLMQEGQGSSATT